jgi:hypothetical protein
VAHARKVCLIGESRRKDDRLDAQTLARLARIDPQLLSPVRSRSAKAQADLTVMRARAGLVRARTALMNTARGPSRVGTLIALTFLLTLGWKDGDSGGSAGEEHVTNKDQKEPLLDSDRPFYGAE